MNRYAAIFKILNRMGRQHDTELRAELCLQVTNGRTDSLKELSDMEVYELTQHLRRLVVETPKDPSEQSLERMRRKCFSIWHELGFETPLGKPDYPRIGSWMTKFSYLHKPLNQYKQNELPKLITQLESMLIKDYEKGETKA